jgi:hypothetical protein
MNFQAAKSRPAVLMVTLLVWTSVAFLLDRRGKIRYIHPGGACAKEPMRIFPSAQKDYQELRAAIEKLLAE